MAQQARGGLGLRQAVSSQACTPVTATSAAPGRWGVLETDGAGCRSLPFPDSGCRTLEGILGERGTLGTLVPSLPPAHWASGKDHLPRDLTLLLTPPGLSFCQLQKQQVLLSGYLNSTATSYVPQCQGSGEYTPVQCDMRREQCWCVDSEGMEVYGTRQPGRPTRCKYREDQLPRRGVQLSPR